MNAIVLLLIRRIIVPMAIGAAVLSNGMPDPSMPVPGEIEVVESVNHATRYRLRFGFNIEEGDLPLLANDLIGPESDLSVIVPADPVPSILASGPVVQQDISLTQGGEGSNLYVYGMDATVTMDRENKAVARSNVNDSTAVLEILASYGLVPDVSTTSTMHTDMKHALVQRETDLRFIRRLARRNGFWFWLSEQAPGVTVAHFKPPPVDDDPALELRINVSAPNIDAVDISWNTETPVSASLAQLDLNSLGNIDGRSERSTVSGLASDHLADVVDATRQLHLAVPSDDAGDLTARGDAALIDHGWFVKARITARQTVLKGLVRANTVVRLTGAGSRHSGKYLVSRVVHSINEEDHVMTVDLIRNAWNG